MSNDGIAYTIEMTIDVVDNPFFIKIKLTNKDGFPKCSYRFPPKNKNFEENFEEEIFDKLNNERKRISTILNFIIKKNQLLFISI